MEEENLSPMELIQRAKMRYMQEESKHIDWKEIEDSLVSQWYGVSKVMGTIIPKTFPYFTFEGLSEEIVAEHERSKENKTSEE